MLRARYGNEIAIVFIGPCIAKKTEAEQHPELLDAVLTFEDLEHWLGRREHSPGRDRRDARRPLSARGGRRGRALSHRRRHGSRCRQQRGQQLAVHGLLRNLQRRAGAARASAEWKPEHNIFFELTACAGSCVNGPKAARNTSVARRRYDVLHYAKPAGELPRKLALGIDGYYSASPIARNEYSETAVARGAAHRGQILRRG